MFSSTFVAANRRFSVVIHVRTPRPTRRYCTYTYVYIHTYTVNCNARAIFEPGGSRALYYNTPYYFVQYTRNIENASGKRADLRDEYVRGKNCCRMHLVVNVSVNRSSETWISVGETIRASCYRQWQRVFWFLFCFFSFTGSDARATIQIRNKTEYKIQTRACAFGQTNSETSPCSKTRFSRYRRRHLLCRTVKISIETTRCRLQRTDIELIIIIIIIISKPNWKCSVMISITGFQLL